KTEELAACLAIKLQRDTSQTLSADGWDHLCSGRLEVKSSQSNQGWSSVCEDDFDQQDAEVVCKSLAVGSFSLPGGLYGAVEAPMWTKEFHVELSRKVPGTRKPGFLVSDRLVGGASRCAGELQGKNGEWRPLLFDNWNLKTASVACRELGCGSAVSLTRQPSYKYGWRMSFECLQSGLTLRECLSVSRPFSFDLIMELTCSESVRLVDGAGLCSGRLEVKSSQSNQGGPQCVKMTLTSRMQRWSVESLAVGLLQSSRGALWGSGGSNVDQRVPILELTCLESVRLVNGTSLCSGRLEVKSSQSNQGWSSVCEDDFDQQDAEVVCRELGCGSPSVFQGGLYGAVEAPMWTKEFQCGGNESALMDCRSSGSTRSICSPGKAVGLTCSEPVRLVGGASRCAGELQLKQQEWRPVYWYPWNIKAASVVCRQLGCGSAVSATLREVSDRPVWRIIDCTWRSRHFGLLTGQVGLVLHHEEAAWRGMNLWSRELRLGLVSLLIVGMLLLLPEISLVP
ncbi:hypothetical protein INR49_030242, partial [Caranx melampygus]